MNQGEGCLGGKHINIRIKENTEDTKLLALPLLTQEQLGHQNDDSSMATKISDALKYVNDSKDKAKQLNATELGDYVQRATATPILVLTSLEALRKAANADDSPESYRTIDWKIAPDNVGMGVGGSELPASMFQAANPIFILLFGLVFTAIWSYLGTHGLDPSIPIKFFLALVQLSIGFAVMWYGSRYAVDSRGVVGMQWVILGILFHTTGELCKSPIGLSMISTLSPKLLVSTVMGMWFLGMAVANDLSAVIASFTGISHGDKGPQIVPPPIDTVNNYGHVFGQIAIGAFIASLVCLALSPLLKKWMHTESELN